jgi:hypothetical protein
MAKRASRNHADLVAGEPSTQSTRKFVLGHAAHRQCVVADHRLSVVDQHEGPGQVSALVLQCVDA